MSAYQAKPTHAFKQRVTDSTGKRGTFSTGTTDPDTKDAVVAFVKLMKKRRRWDVLDPIVAKSAKLKAAFDAYEKEELEEFVAALGEPDLSKMVTEWEQSGASPRYVSQVRGMIPEGVRFPASKFTRKAVSKHVSGLQDSRASKNKRKASNSTKNRHKAGLSQFAQWLIEQEVIETNPVRDVKGKTENPAREVWYPWKDAKAIVMALEEPYRSLEALMAGTGMEWSATRDSKRSDVNMDTRFIFARGGKNKFRKRWVKVTEDWGWKIVEPHFKKLTPNAPLFDLDPALALKAHCDAVEVLGLEPSTLHDWRHTYAVNNLKSGKLKPAVVKRQLGHAKNSIVLDKVYALYIVDESDYPNDDAETTTLATTPENQLEVRRAK